MKTEFILASVSPRRKKLLTEADYKFKVIASDIDESDFVAEPDRAQAHAEKLALAKAKNVAQKFPDELVIGADTVVDCDGEIIGKADDPQHARQIVEKLFSLPHKVITAIAIVALNRNIEMVQSDTTIIYPKPVTGRQIAEHIRSGTWQDKAGAYAIQETGDMFVERIQGSLTNIMGLSMELLETMLAELER